VKLFGAREGCRIFGGGADFLASAIGSLETSGGFSWARDARRGSFWPDCLWQRYFHSHTLEIVLPAESTSYSKAPQVLLRRPRFCEVVWKKSMPR
jgi:hypothetical protein